MTDILRADPIMWYDEELIRFGWYTDQTYEVDGITYSRYSQSHGGMQGPMCIQSMLTCKEDAHEDDCSIYRYNCVDGMMFSFEWEYCDVCWLDHECEIHSYRVCGNPSPVLRHSVEGRLM